MSCPDWTHAAARREAGPASWQEAVEHFDGCSHCRRDALAADPLLVFRRLPGAELSPAAERSEVESMRQAVTAMRTASRLESRRSLAGWKRWAAAAVLAGVSLGVSRDHTGGPEPAAEPPASWGAAAAALAPTIAPAALEGLDRPAARVYQMNSKDLSVLMIVDESFADESLDV